MNEIDKLYENAGIEKNCYPKMLKCHHCEHYKVIDECTGRCLNEVYSPFTAEKQIELIKWLIASGECYFSITIKPDEFEEYLAKYINNMWKDLADIDKKQIKDILK